VKNRGRKPVHLHTACVQWRGEHEVCGPLDVPRLAEFGERQYHAASEMHVRIAGLMQVSQHLPTLAVVVRTARLKQRLLHTADVLHLRYRLVDLPDDVPPGSASGTGMVWCLEAGVLLDVTRCLGACVLLIPSHGEPSSGVPARIPGGGAVPLRVDALTPGRLLAAVMGAASSTVGDVLGALDMFQPLPAHLIAAFIREPNRFHRVQDLRRALHISRDAAREVVRSTKRFTRTEHLFAALRVALWAFLTSEGVDRSVVEEYLGVQDRGHFRRACARAGAPRPHLGVTLKDFSS
jgi:hypothetical protein